MDTPENSYISSFTLRFTPEERARLEHEAADLPLSVYVRSRLFDNPPDRRVRNKRPVKDFEVLAQLLAQFGKLRISENLDLLARAAACGSLPVTPETILELRKACIEVQGIRRLLIIALALQPEAET